MAITPRCLDEAGHICYDGRRNKQYISCQFRILERSHCRNSAANLPQKILNSTSDDYTFSDNIKTRIYCF